MTSGNKWSIVKAGAGQSSTSTTYDKKAGVAPLINIKEHFPSKSTICLIIQNSSDEDGATYEAEARSSHHSARDCTSQSPVTDKRLTQSQNVTEMPKTTGHAILLDTTLAPDKWLSSEHRTSTGHIANINVMTGTRHQATDSHRTPDNIQQLESNN